MCLSVCIYILRFCLQVDFFCQFNFLWTSYCLYLSNNNINYSHSIWRSEEKYSLSLTSTSMVCKINQKKSRLAPCVRTFESSNPFDHITFSSYKFSVQIYSIWDRYRFVYMSIKYQVRVVVLLVMVTDMNMQLGGRRRSSL